MLQSVFRDVGSYLYREEEGDGCLLCIPVAIIGGCTAESSSDLYLCVTVLTALL